MTQQENLGENLSGGNVTTDAHNQAIKQPTVGEELTNKQLLAWAAEQQIRKGIETAALFLCPTDQITQGNLIERFMACYNETVKNYQPERIAVDGG